MTANLTRKIIGEHLVAGKPVPGSPISVNVDEVLTQDATGTMAYLEFEAFGLSRVAPPIVVSYVDHNTLQSDNKNFDDHLYLMTAAARFGAWFSRPGNGISHQVHLERFGRPGDILLGSDSHTPTAGGLGLLAIGVGGLDAASAMAGFPFEMSMPKVVGVHLTGSLRRPWVTAMDVILTILGKLTVKGGVGRVMEYHGPGAAGLSVPERATITNMGAELGATSSVFPSDETTLAWLTAQGREEDFRAMAADEGADYDETIEIDLSAIEPMVAKPHSPDAVVPARELAGLPVDQVCLGSCSNSSLAVMTAVAEALRGRRTHPRVSLTVSPGSRQVLGHLAADGALAEMIAAGARILESACGPCIGMGQAPPTDGVSVRSFNRNFQGRSGTASAQVYLASPLTGVAAALTGALGDPRDAGIEIDVPADPLSYGDNDALLLAPPAEGGGVEIVRGPNIKPLPVGRPLDEDLSGRILLKVGDNITTDHIMPAGAEILPLRSNIPAISRHVFAGVDPGFAARAEEWGGGFILGGENYGQGSSREHAALAPMYLGVRGVIVKSYARIHRGNLVNFGIVPLVLADPADYDLLAQGDTLELKGLRSALLGKKGEVIARPNDGRAVRLVVKLSERERDVLVAGGLLPYLRASLGR
jgi:aconitate hydratase